MDWESNQVRASKLGKILFWKTQIKNCFFKKKRGRLDISIQKSNQQLDKYIKWNCSNSYQTTFDIKLVSFTLEWFVVEFTWPQLNTNYLSYPEKKYSRLSRLQCFIVSFCERLNKLTRNNSNPALKDFPQKTSPSSHYAFLSIIDLSGLQNKLQKQR